MSDSPRYLAHARRIDVLRRAADDPIVREYYTGYRHGMVRSTRDADGQETDDARAELAERAIAGEIDTPSRLACGCGYHDGLRWADPTQHRGLIRLAAHRQASGSVRALAREVLGVDEGSLRRLLRGERPIPAGLLEELRDALLGPAATREG